MPRAAPLLLALLVALPGCLTQGDDGPDTSTTPGVSTPNTTPPTTTPHGATTPATPTSAGPGTPATTLLEANARFAMDLLRELNEDTRGENLVVSPYSIATALQMTYGGANGTTRTAMAEALRLGSAEPTVDAQARALREELTTDVPNVTLRIANALWLDSTFAPEVDEAFQKRIGSSYSGELRRDDFGDPATVDEVNAWASEATNGSIPEILQELRPEEVLILLNAVLLEARWQIPFEPSCTHDATFRREDGTTRTVDMMCLPVSGWAGRRDMATMVDGTTVVRLAYGNSGRFEMLAMLPAKGTSVDDLAATWNGTFPETFRSDAELSMPRIAIRTQGLDLEPPLTELGMGIAFDRDRADFTRIARNVFVSRVIHDALLEVDENGTRAAAVTTVIGGVTSLPPPPVPVVLDRPFLVAIRDSTTGTLLFLAKVHDP